MEEVPADRPRSRARGCLKAVALGLFALTLGVGLTGTLLSETPLHEAARAGDLEGLREALGDGFGVDDVAHGIRGWKHGETHHTRATPLTLATDRGHLEAMRVLIEAGADPGIPGTNGRTPLHEAVSRGDEAMVRLLLDAGADPGREDRWGGTPAEVARDLAARGGADLTALVGPVR